MSPISIWPTPQNGANPTLTPYKADASKRTGAAVIVCPGGGYARHADHEGEPVALWLNSVGVDAFVLTYRLAPNHKHPEMWEDAARAIRTVRAGVEQSHIDPARIGILGFSAGGHLASSAAVHFDDGDPKSSDAIERAGCRPDIAVLIYPVITMDGPHAHAGSRASLLGETPDPALVHRMSSHLQVTERTPPTFLVHSADDGGVTVENSLMFAEALSRNKVAFEMHVYEHGGHGYGMAADDPALNAWTGACALWLKRHGFAK